MLLPFLSSEKYEKLSEIYNQGRKKSERVIIVANILNIEANSDENEFYPNSRWDRWLICFIKFLGCEFW